MEIILKKVNEYLVIFIFYTTVQQLWLNLLIFFIHSQFAESANL